MRFATVIARFIFLLLAVTFVTATIGSNSANEKVFTTPDGTFRFVYPAEFVLCTQGSIEQCNQHSFIPLCDSKALVCVAYPPRAFQGTNFESAGFEVRQVVGYEPHPEATAPRTSDQCATPVPRGAGTEMVGPYPDYLVSADHPVEVISGVSFIHSVSGGVATGHSSGTDLYRNFHNGKCYELSVTVTESEVLAPGTKEFTAADQKKVEAAMSKILHSFQFLK
jgi:hypothetical protein